jgi:hypothetical protein
VALERGPLSLVSNIEELLGRNSSDSGLETREYGCGDPLRWQRDTFYPQKLALTSPTSGGRSVGIVRLRTKPLSLFCFCFDYELTGTFFSTKLRHSYKSCRHVLCAAWTRLSQSGCGRSRLVKPTLMRH